MRESTVLPLANLKRDSPYNLAFLPYDFMAHSKFVGDTDHALSAITSPLYELENKHILQVTSLFLVAEVLVS